MNKEKAAQFAEAWIRAWNAHDLETILSHYADPLEFYSPLIPLLKFNGTGLITDRQELGRYFATGLKNYPDLNFELHNYFVGINTLVLCYTSVNGRQAAEVIELDERGKAVKVYCNYADAATGKNWITHPLHLQGAQADLVPLEREHFSALQSLSKDPRIWQHYVLDGSNTLTLEHSLETALSEREKGIQYPFVIIRRSDHKVIGSTRFLDIQQQHKKLEIGWTWLHPDAWATGINQECKMLLLSFCFEELFAARVQLKTDENNIRSRRAIEKTGARFEGILRNDMVREDGSHRNSAYYSITDKEWTSLKQAPGNS